VPSVKLHYVLNALSAANRFIVVGGAGYSIYLVQARRYGWYLPSVTGTAVTQPVHAKFLPSRWLPSQGHGSNLHRRYKIYSVNWD
jgi:hypothetical protein